MAVIITRFGGREPQPTGSWAAVGECVFDDSLEEVQNLNM